MDKSLKKDKKNFSFQDRASYFGKLPLLTRIAWIIMRGAILAWCIYEFANGNTKNGLQALFSFIFSHLWDMFQFFGKNSFISKLSYHSQTALTIFIFFGSFIGTIFPILFQLSWYDKALHLISGAIATWAAYDFAMIMQGKKKPLSPALASLFSIGFSFFIAVGWEFYEFSMDTLHGTTLQFSSPFSNSGLLDTMGDLFFCAVGTMATMFLVAFYKNGYIGKNRKKRRAKLIEDERIWNERYDKMMALEEPENTNATDND